MKDWKEVKDLTQRKFFDAGFEDREQRSESGLKKLRTVSGSQQKRETLDLLYSLEWSELRKGLKGFK